MHGHFYRIMHIFYFEPGIEQGRRPELVGGGLIRSLGGWRAVKNARFSGQDRVKGDHRILGDSAFGRKQGGYIGSKKTFARLPL